MLKEKRKKMKKNKLLKRKKQKISSKILGKISL